jgi:hypothetical protein
MAAASGTALFYAVFIAPGFVAVIIAISLAAIERDARQFTLLALSLVSSLLIDTLFLATYQFVSGPISSPSRVVGLLFTPRFRTDYIAAIFGLSVVFGLVYAALILVDLPESARRLLQSRQDIKLTPRQPWTDFMRDAKTIRIKTSDDELYVGEVAGWSRAGKPRQLRISSPDQYSKHELDFEPIGLDDMIFFEEDISRIVIWERDE